MTRRIACDLILARRGTDWRCVTAARPTHEVNHRQIAQDTMSSPKVRADQPPGRNANMSNHHLTAAQIQRYQTEGYLSPLPALDAELARSTLDKVEAYEAQHGEFPSKGLKAHLYLPWMERVVRLPTILDAIESIVGPDILCWSSRFFIKDPGDGGFVSWHQDVTYWGLDVSENILTAWIALSPATRANGVMKVIPGSHTKVVAHREGAASNMLLRGQEVAVEVDESQAVHMELKAGEMSLHHGLMFHGS